MYLQKVYSLSTKKDLKNQKTYTYYRLTSSHRIGNKVRQTVILNLGKLETISKSEYKALANRIEEIISGVENSLFPVDSQEIENLAQSFAKKIVKDKIFPSKKGKSISKEIENNYQNIDIDTLEQLESKEIGGE